MNNFIKCLQDNNLLGKLIKDQQDIHFLQSLNNIIIEQKQSKQGKKLKRNYFNWFIILNNGEKHALNSSKTDLLYVKHYLNIYCKTCGKLIGKRYLSQIFYLKYNKNVMINPNCYFQCKHCAAKNNSINGQEKCKKTCLERYGTQYSFQSENNKIKSIQTKLKKYGENWKKIQANYMINYWKNNKRIHHNGDDPVVRAKMVQSWKKTVAKKTPEELKIWRSKVIGISQSKMSIQFFDKLSKILNMNIEIEYLIKDEKRSYFLDGFIKDICVFQFLGDYWHANPEIYNENDILSYHKIKMIVKDIWKRDQVRLERYSKNN